MTSEEHQHPSAPTDSGELPDFAELEPGRDAFLPTVPGEPAARPSLAPLSDIPVTVEAVLGSVTMTVDELLGLGSGSVIEVDRRVGDPIDLVVGGRLLARGELVLIDGALGLTLTEIVRREEA